MSRNRSILDNLRYVARRSGLWVPQPLQFAGGRKCCCEPCACSICTGDVPRWMTVTFSGLTNVNCDYCESYNQSFCLECDYDATGGCTWIWSGPGSPCTCHCGALTLSITGPGPGGKYRLNVKMEIPPNPPYHSGYTSLWGKLYDAPFDCNALSNVTIPQELTQNVCTGNCTVSSGKVDDCAACNCAPCLYWAEPPDAYLVTLAGFINNDCNDCVSAINGAFVCERIGDGTGTSCDYGYDLGYPCGGEPGGNGYGGVAVTLGTFLWYSGITVGVGSEAGSSGESSPWHAWSDYANCDVPCNTINQYLTHVTFRNTPCDDSAATCHIQAL